MTGAIGLKISALGTPPAPLPAAAAAGSGHPRQALAHEALVPRGRPAPDVGPLRLAAPAAHGIGASPMLRPGPGPLAARAARQDTPAPPEDDPSSKRAPPGGGTPPPFDLGMLDFPLVFPMPPIDPVNPARVPHVPAPPDAKYPNTVSMLSAYANEQHGMVFGQKVPYLGEQERQAFKVSVKDGLLHGADGRPFDTRQATASGEATGHAIYVMDHAGELYLSNKAGLAEFQHTSFLAGQPVAAAGTIRVEDGRVQEITRKSGHYRPAAEFLDQAVAELKARGVAPDFAVVKDV